MAASASRVVDAPEDLFFGDDERRNELQHPAVAGGQDDQAASECGRDQRAGQLPAKRIPGRASARARARRRICPGMTVSQGTEIARERRPRRSRRAPADARLPGRTSAASDAAQARGLPRNVLVCRASPCRGRPAGHQALGTATQAEMGSPPPIALPTHRMSGRTSSD